MFKLWVPRKICVSIPVGEFWSCDGIDFSDNEASTQLFLMEPSLQRPIAFSPFLPKQTDGSSILLEETIHVRFEQRVH